MKKSVPPVKFFPLLLLIALLLITSPLVFAHTGDKPHYGWFHGFTHPLSGLDHILAMVAGGIGLALLCKKFASARWIRFSGIIIAGYGDSYLSFKPLDDEVIHA